MKLPQPVFRIIRMLVYNHSLEECILCHIKPYQEKCVFPEEFFQTESNESLSQHPATHIPTF